MNHHTILRRYTFETKLAWPKADIYITSRTICDGTEQELIYNQKKTMLRCFVLRVNTLLVIRLSNLYAWTDTCMNQ
jgi:hypothetical protein